MKISVLGAGAWGTALARLLQQRGNNVTLWGHRAAHLEEIRRTNRNESFLPGIEVPREIKLEVNLTNAVSKAECVVVAIPSKAFREVTGALKNFPGTGTADERGRGKGAGYSINVALPMYTDDAFPIVQRDALGQRAVFSVFNTNLPVPYTVQSMLSVERGFGKTIVSSADLVARFEAVWSEEQVATHFAARASFTPWDAALWSQYLAQRPFFLSPVPSR